MSLAQLSSMNKQGSHELDHMRELYRREALQRKLLYNKVRRRYSRTVERCWHRFFVVFSCKSCAATSACSRECVTTPTSRTACASSTTRPSWRPEATRTTSSTKSSSPRPSRRRFGFECSHFSLESLPLFMSCSQIFEDALPTITSCVDGYNVCIMAYGQTGAFLSIVNIHVNGVMYWVSRSLFFCRQW